MSNILYIYNTWTRHICEINHRYMIINKQNFKIFKYLHHFLGKNKKIQKNLY